MKLRQIYPNESLIPAGKYGLKSESIILCHQIRTIDKKRLSRKYGQIDDNLKKEEIIDYSGQSVHPIRSKVYNLIWD